MCPGILVTESRSARTLACLLDFPGSHKYRGGQKYPDIGKRDVMYVNKVLFFLVVHR